MSFLDNAEVIVIDDFTKGLDVYGDVTETEKGAYPEADNMILTRRVLSTVVGTTRHTATAAPNSETVIYAVVFTLVGGTSEHLVYTSGGTWYRLVTDTYTQLRTGLSTAPTYLSHAPFRSRMVLANGVDAVQSWDGTTMLPIGAKMVSTMGATSVPGGTWTGGTNYTTNVREGTEARQLTASGASTVTMRIAYTATQNFLTGPQSGDPNFDAAASGDAFRAQVFVISGAANITSVDFRFYSTYSTVYFQGSATGFSAGWNAVSLTRNGMTDVGTANWAAITTFEVRLITTGAADIAVDDSLFQYLTNPVPVANIAVIYNNFLILGDQTADRVRVSMSTVSQIDSFPTANFVRVTGGGYSLEQGDRINGMKVYSSVVIIGKPRSIHALSGTPTSTTVDVATVETGIDGHNSMVESPFALLYVYGNRIHAFRLTGRSAISQKIGPLLATTNQGGLGPGLDVDNAQRHVSIRHDETHSIRWSFAEIGNANNTLQLWYDYDRDAWISEILYAVRHYHHAIVSGTREIHATQYDGFLQRLDVGTTFDGTAIASRVLLPWVAGPRKQPEDLPAVVRWLGAILLLDGNTDVTVEYRVADTPAEATGAFTEATGSPLSASTPDAEKGFVGFGNVLGRFCQIRARTTSGRMELHTPVFIYYEPVTGRKGP